MGRYSDNPQIDQICEELAIEFQQAADAYAADPTESNYETLDIITNAFANARRSARNDRLAFPVIGGDATPDGVN